MPYDRQLGRFITVTLDYRTGTHQIWNKMPLSHAKCIAICQSMGPIEAQHKHRLILKAHDDDPQEDV